MQKWWGKAWQQKKKHKAYIALQKLKNPHSFKKEAWGGNATRVSGCSQT